MIECSALMPLKLRNNLGNRVRLGDCAARSGFGNFSFPRGSLTILRRLILGRLQHCGDLTHCWFLAAAVSLKQQARPFVHPVGTVLAAAETRRSLGGWGLLPIFRPVRSPGLPP